MMLRSNNNNYVLGKPKTNFMKKSFTYSAASLWNGLSSTAKEKGMSLNKFKCILSSTGFNITLNLIIFSVCKNLLVNDVICVILDCNSVQQTAP